MIELEKIFQRAQMYKISKRYKDIFEQYFYKGEPTPLSIGTLAVCALCFLFLIVSTFTQVIFSHPWLEYIQGTGLQGFMKIIIYNPQVVVMIFIIYLLGRNYSYLTFITYLLTGFFIWPVFAYGGGFEYIKNYLFGYLLGFVVAAYLINEIFKYGQNYKMRLLASAIGVLSIHLCGFVYCIILALFGKLEFGIWTIFKAITLNKILYDLFFSAILLLIAPYIKSIFWICMTPKADRKKR